MFIFILKYTYKHTYEFRYLHNAQLRSAEYIKVKAHNENTQ